MKDVSSTGEIKLVPLSLKCYDGVDSESLIFSLKYQLWSILSPKCWSKRERDSSFCISRYKYVSLYIYVYIYLLDLLYICMYICVCI